MSLRAYRLARHSILDAARRRHAPTLRAALTPAEHAALVSCRAVVAELRGTLTLTVLSRLSAGTTPKGAH
jgi:hypothetical protein